MDTTATVRADTFGAALATVGGDAGVDAVLALVVRTAAADLVPALTAARLPVPLAAVLLDQPESVRLLPQRRRRGPGAGLRLPGKRGPGAQPGGPVRIVALPARRGPSRTSQGCGRPRHAS